MVRIALSLALVVLLGVGCRSVETPYRYPADLSHPNAVKRSKAVMEFAQRQDRAQLPEAFRLLLDDEAHIRAVAHVTIRSLTPEGKDFGYEPYLEPDIRIGVVARWEAWWRKSQAAEAQGG